MAAGFDLLTRLAPVIVYAFISVTYWKRDKRQRAELRFLRERVAGQSAMITDVCEERDMAAQYAASLETLVTENEKIVSAADIEIAASQTRQWIHE